MLRAQMFKQGESPNRQKTAGCFFEKKKWAKYEVVFV